ncbi:MAG: serine hydrolase [Christensenellales bacterium]|jgi:beta-lactamase class A
MTRIFERLSRMPGKTALWHMDLRTGAATAHRADLPLIAASVIKLFIMAEAFRQFESGAFDPREAFIITPEAKLPSCGALTYMHDHLRVTAMDLVTLMIILSDNTATNLLIDRLGMPAINALIADYGFSGCALNRKLFDREASLRGVQNYVTARGVGEFLLAIWERRLISPAASDRMLRILRDQRLNGKIPFFLDCPVAHKTGEDDGITHDAAIVMSERPFILVMLANEVHVPAFERLMQDAARGFAGGDA